MQHPHRQTGRHDPRQEPLDLVGVDCLAHEDEQPLPSQLAHPALAMPGGSRHGIGEDDARHGGRRLPARRATRPETARIGRGQGAVDVPEGLGQSAGVDQRDDLLVLASPLEDLLAPMLGLLRLRDKEVHRRGGHREVLASSGLPLALVAADEPRTSPPLHGEGNLPGGVLDIRHAAVEAPRTERRHQMGDVARKEEPSNAEAIGAARMEAIDRHPVDPIVTLLADDLADALVQRPVGLRSRQVEVGVDLPVDPEDAVRARVDEHLTPRVPLGVEVEPALVLPPFQGGFDVADEE